MPSELSGKNYNGIHLQVYKRQTYIRLLGLRLIIIDAPNVGLF